MKRGLYTTEKGRNFQRQQKALFGRGVQAKKKIKGRGRSYAGGEGKKNEPRPFAGAIS